MKPLPIVFVHMGDSFYLKYALSNAIKFNPDSKIYLIADGTKEEFEGVTKLDLNKFTKYSKELEKLYVHKSKSNPAIELFCIKRWFVLREFMEKYKFKEVFALDSDVLLYVNVTTDANNYLGYDFLLAKGRSAGMTLIRGNSTMVAYTKLVLDFYKNKVGKVEYEPDCTITDMSFWRILKDTKKFKVGEITDIIKNETYDAGVLNEQKELFMKNGSKEIVFKDFLPYGVTKTGNVRLKCIHCQGPTKFYMKYYSKGNLTLFDLLIIKMMMWFRNNFSPIMSTDIRNSAKKLVSVLGF